MLAFLSPELLTYSLQTRSRRWKRKLGDYSDALPGIFVFFLFIALVFMNL